MEFKALFDFLERFGPEVTGRAASEPQPEVMDKLVRFAQGEASPREMEEVCEILKDNPAWLRWAAQQIRESRTERQTAKPQARR